MPSEISIEMIPPGRRTHSCGLAARGVTSDLDIWRSAKLLVNQHGADAPIRAAERADEMLAAGDIEGRSVWLRILEAVKQLTAMKPPGPVH